MDMSLPEGISFTIFVVVTIAFAVWALYLGLKK
jgi:hypothetical protein